MPRTMQTARLRSSSAKRKLVDDFDELDEGTDGNGVSSSQETLSVRFSPADSMSRQEIYDIVKEVLAMRPLPTYLVDSAFFDQCAKTFPSTTLDIVREGVGLGYKGDDLWYFVFPQLLSRFVAIYRSVVADLRFDMFAI